MTNVNIYVFSTYFVIPIIFNESSRYNRFNIKDVNNQDTSISLDHLISNYLTEFDRDNNPKYQYVYYNKKYKGLCMPYFCLSYILSEMDKNKIRYSVHYRLAKLNNSKNIPKHIKLRSNFQVRDNNQIKWINFLVNSNTRSPNKRFRLLDIQTGKGKTICGIVSVLKIGKRSLIIVPSNLVNQWIVQLKNLLTIKDTDIYKIVGSKSIMNLSNKVSNNDISNESVFVTSIRTLYNYIHCFSRFFPSNTIPCFELFNRLKFGVKLVDELHMNFYANVSVDLISDIPLNIYLTATPGRSNKKSEEIFHMLYPMTIRYNMSSYDKYLTAYEVEYSFKDYQYLPIEYFSINGIGYSNIRYEKYIFKRMYLFKRIINNIIYKLVKPIWLDKKDRKKGKLIIYASLKKTVKFLESYLKSNSLFNRFNITSFLAGDSDSKLVSNDIIITTVKSLSTGKDVKNIKMMVILVSIRSEILIEQIIGRIRKDLKNPIVCFCYSGNVGSQIRHHYTRYYVLKKLTNVKSLKIKV